MDLYTTIFIVTYYKTFRIWKQSTKNFYQTFIFIVFSDPIQNGKLKKEQNIFFFYQPCQQKGNRNESWSTDMSLLELLRDRHIYREVEWCIQLLPWQHVTLPIMMSLKFIFGIPWEGHIFKCILMYSCRSIFYQTELLRTRVHYSKHSGFKHSFYRWNDFLDLMNHLCRIPSFSRDVSSYITNSLWK